MAVMIFVNYQYHVDDQISHHHGYWYPVITRTSIFIAAFGIPYLLYRFYGNENIFSTGKFVCLFFIACLLFAFKHAFELPFSFADRYIELLIYWPLLTLIMVILLYCIWLASGKEHSFYGFTTKNMNWRPYIIMLMIMVPLITIASTQHDFLAMYPKARLIIADHNEKIAGWKWFLFELGYGTDFITIELFFRGFLVLAFLKWAGPDAILPMACFYCTIHFGKPLGECISSYFGGLLLGIIVYNTRSILGGLMVHLGIAWMMEAGGWIGNSFN